MGGCYEGSLGKSYKGFEIPGNGRVMDFPFLKGTAYTNKLWPLFLGSPRPLHPLSYTRICFEGEGRTSTHPVLGASCSGEFLHKFTREHAHTSSKN